MESNDRWPYITLMPHVYEQADGSWMLRYGKRNGKALSHYHRWLKVGRRRLIRRQVRLMLKQGIEPPAKVGYHGWET